jgi:hypothetical protein
LYDVAFQKYVVQKSFPDLHVSAYLLLSDKTVTATVDGLNQCVFIYQEGSRYRVKKSTSFDDAKLGDKILTEQNVDDLCTNIISNQSVGFEQLVEKLFAALCDGYKDVSRIGCRLW